jgi:hypothetical protein
LTTPVSNPHTRKSFFAKTFAGLVGLGLLGGTRLGAKTASAPAPTLPADPVAAAAAVGIVVKTDARAVARHEA